MRGIKEKSNHSLTVFQWFQYIFIYLFLFFSILFGSLCVFYSRLLEGVVILISAIITFFFMLYIQRLDYRANRIRFRSKIGTKMFDLLNIEFIFNGNDINGNIFLGLDGICFDGIGLSSSDIISGQVVLLYSDLLEYDFTKNNFYIKLSDGSRLEFCFDNIKRMKAFENYLDRKYSNYRSKNE